MNRKQKILSVIASLVFILSGCSASNQRTEDSQKEQRETSQDKKIVATTVGITEIFDQLTIDLAGVPTSSTPLPERYASVPKVGNPMSPDIEAIALLQPDIVYSTKSLEASLKENFQKANLASDYLDLTSIPAMLKEITSLGKTYHREEEAKKIVDSFQSTMSDIDTRVQNKKKVKVLILMGLPGSYIVATEYSYLGNLVSLAGGINAITGEEREFISANTEVLQASHPDIILRAAHGMPEEVIQMFAEEFQTNDIWQHFDAVKNDRVYDLDYSLFGITASLKSDQALKKMEHILYDE